MADLRALATLFNGSLEEINASWGKPGVPGDELEIKRAVDILEEGLNGALEWELDLRTTVFPEEFELLTELMCGWAGMIITQMETYPNQLADIFINNTPPVRGHITISSTFEAPDNIEQVSRLVAGRDR